MGCFWGKRDNNSYVSTHKTDKVCTADGKCYNYNDVFVDEVDPGYSNTCGQTCYVACSCNTSNGWYSSCQGSDCFSVTDTRYAGQPNAASASRSLSDVASISASGANSGISASAAAAKSGLKTASAAGNYTATAASAGLKTASVAVATAGATSGISTMASGATTCYKKKTCSEGGYYDSVPADQKCSPKNYNGYSCYTSCSYKTCSDYGYNSSIPSGKTCTTVYPRSGLTCYKDCKDDTPAKDFYVHISGGGSGITGNGTLGAFIDKGGPLSSVDVFICFTCGVGCLSGTATVAQKLDNLGSYSGCYNNIPEYDGNTCYISGVGLLEDTVYEGDTFTVSGKKYKLICK